VETPFELRPEGLVQFRGLNAEEIVRASLLVIQSSETVEESVLYRHRVKAEVEWTVAFIGHGADGAALHGFKRGTELKRVRTHVAAAPKDADVPAQVDLHGVRKSVAQTALGLDFGP